MSVQKQEVSSLGENDHPTENDHQIEDDFARQPVPADKTLSGIHIAFVVIGGTIGIPVFLMSANIGGQIGLSSAMMAFSFGCFILGILGGLTSLTGARTHLSTYMLVEFAFGRKGAKLVNLIIALSLIGWYGVTINVFAQAMDIVVRDLLNQELARVWYIFGGSILMCGVTVSGFKGIDKLAIILVPFMIIFLLYAAVISYDMIPSWDRGNSTSEGLDFSGAVSAVIGSYIVGVVIQPDYSRFAKSPRHALWAVFIALGVSFPIVMILSAIPALGTGESDLVKIMILLGIGVPAFLLLLLGSWSSNVLSLYSSALSFSTIVAHVPLWKIIVAIGTVGTGLAFLDIQEYLVDFLLLLGISIPPVAAIYVIEVLINRKSNCDIEGLKSEPAINKAAFFAWGSAILMGFLAQNSVFSITTIAAMDTIVISAFIYLSCLYFSKKNKGAEK